MLRAVLAGGLLALAASQPPRPALTLLRIHVELTTADGAHRPVPRFVLLVSDNPTTAPPRRTVTAGNGTAELHLPPGSYTIESDRPVAFDGKSYEWAQTVTVPADRDVTVELNERNALGDATPAAAPDEPDFSAIEMRWRDSVVELWSETGHGSGFLVDASGLIATNHRVVGDSSSVEVQLSRTTKIAGRVVANDAAKDVAVVWIDPAAIPAAQPMTLRYGAQPKPDETVFTIGVPPLQDKQMTSGNVQRVDARTIDTDAPITTGSAGGPVFTASGDVIGLSTFDATSLSALPEVIRIDAAKDVIAAALANTRNGRPPAPAHLPVEPARRLSDAALTASVARDGVRLPYQMASDDFDVHFITPVMTFGAQYHAEQLERRARAQGVRHPGPPKDPLEDFENWRDYITDFLPVLMIRATPKLTEGFWQALGRNAAQTQGVTLPALKHLKTPFGSMRLYCGTTEIAPIHPFKIAHPLDTSGRDDTPEVVYEGLYVFPPDAVSPQCGTVKVVLVSEKDPQSHETITLDPAIVERIAQDLRSGWP